MIARSVENVAVDAISRCYFVAWSTPNLEWLHTLKADLEKDDNFRRLLQQCTQDQINYCCKNDILLWNNRVVIPPTNNLIQLILKDFHDSPSGGHYGITKIVEKVCSAFYWPNMQKAKTENKRKPEPKLPAGLLQSLPVPSQVWEQICMDFITTLSLIKGYSVIMVVIDRLTKFAHFLSLKPDFNASVSS